MPTTLPRVYLTLAVKDDTQLQRLSEELGVSRPAVLRKALREMAKRRLKPTG